MAIALPPSWSAVKTFLNHQFVLARSTGQWVGRKWEFDADGPTKSEIFHVHADTNTSHVCGRTGRYVKCLACGKGERLPEPDEAAKS